MDFSKAMYAFQQFPHLLLLYPVRQGLNPGMLFLIQLPAHNNLCPEKNRSQNIINACIRICYPDIMLLKIPNSPSGLVSRIMDMVISSAGCSFIDSP